MNLKRYLVPLLFLAGVYMDSIFFTRLNLFGIRPDMLMALIVSYGMLMGRLPAAVLGCGLGLFMDAMFGKMLGLTAICYLLAAYTSGFFYQKYYADNFIMPAAIAGVAQLVSEHLMGLGMLLRGGSFPYLQTLTTYIVPCAVATGLLCIPLHLLVKSALGQQARLHGAETHRG